VAVEPICWLAADNRTNVVATCESATCQAKTTTKLSINYFTKPKITGNDHRKWK